MNVICDINVWYKLGKHGFSLAPELQGYNLHLTNLSLLELVSSGRLKSDFKSVQETIVAITKYGDILSQNDAQQLVLAHDPTYVDNLAYSQFRNISRLINAFIEAESIDDLDYDFIGLINERELETKQWCLTIYDFIESLREQEVRDFPTVKRFVEEFLVSHMKAYLNKNSPQTKIPKVDLSEFELFTECFSLYLLDLVAKPSKKVDKNDYVDFMNLLYCTGEFKYLTLESEKKNRLATMLRDSKVSEKYLLSNNFKIKEKLNQIIL